MKKIIKYILLTFVISYAATMIIDKICKIIHKKKIEDGYIYFKDLCKDQTNCNNCDYYTECYSPFEEE